MVNYTGYMIRDKKTGRWHNWGGLTEWLPESIQGGTLWTDRDAARDFVAKYNEGSDSHGVVAELVYVEIKRSSAAFDCWELAADAKHTGVMPNNQATAFALFKDGVIVRKLTKEEAIALNSEVRLFAIP